MQKRAFAILAPAVMTAFLLLVAGCRNRGIEELVREELFTLTLGRLEDQVDLFQGEGGTVDRRNRISMADGLFYVANGNAGKIMEFSSYGDLLFLLYNPQANPAPVTLGTGNDTGAVSTLGSVAYPFLDIGEIAVASDKSIFVEDAAPESKVVKNTEKGIVLTRVILRFDRKGKTLGSIGQEGLGGTPFPFIAGMYVTSKDQLVVVCRLPDSWQVFWYTVAGVRMYWVEIDSAHLPSMEDAGLTPFLVNIFPDMQNPLLYLLVYAYRDAGEDSSRSGSNGGTVSARVYKLNLATRSYESFVEFPQTPSRKEKIGLKTTEIPSPPSDLLGIGANGFYYLLGYTDSNLYTLQILDAAGRLRATRLMVIEDSELTYRDMRLSPSGIIYGLLCDQTRAHVSWWRSDLLLKGE